MKSTILVKITFENGDSTTTRINLNLEDAKKYYIGKYFNLGTVKDNMQKATKVEKV